MIQKRCHTVFNAQNGWVLVKLLSCDAAEVRGQWSVQLGDGQTAADLDGVDGRQRRHAVVEVKELMAVHQHTEARVLTVDLNPERLLCDEGEVGYRSLLLAPVIRNTGVSQNLPVFELYAHIQSDVPAAARQTDVKTVRICVHDAHDGDFLPWPHSSPDAAAERHGQFLLLFFLR